MGPSRKLAFLFVFLTGCGASSPWRVSHLQGAHKEFSSARLMYPIRDIVNGVSVEMIYAQDSLRTYVAVHSQTIPPFKGNTKEAFISLKVLDQSFQGVGHRHAGGQRVLLPAELQNILIQNLLGGKPITIQLQGYSTTVEPDQFAAEYQKLKKAPFNFPIQLPFK